MYCGCDWSENPEVLKLHEEGEAVLGEWAILLPRHLVKFIFMRKRGKGNLLISDRASNMHTDNVSRIIHQFGGATGGGKNKKKINLGNLTPTKRRLVQNQNLKILIDSFQSSPLEYNPEKLIIGY